MIEIVQMLARRGQQGGDVRPLEGRARPLRVVLVVNGHHCVRLDDPFELTAQCGYLLQCADTVGCRHPRIDSLGSTGKAALPHGSLI
ncbi:hypothetical protein [Streptomyces sp. TP-A0356]|uniref:hypothetical protein n=1 Tax=Streptomyces sp. TP-A0356 TaxID=1359208 RepID=UPI00131A64FD